MKITGRQRTLLGLIIREYVDSTSPVSSKGLREKYSLPFSPATIRNEMAALTERGLIRQPHTSAGRVPTEEGYRYFVQQLMGEVELPLAEQNTISHQFHQAGPEVSQWMRLAASVLSQHTRGAGLITVPQSTSVYFKHVELIATQGRQVLMVLVLMGGEVRQQILSLAEPVPQEQLSEAAAHINIAFINLDSDTIRAAAAHLNTFEQEIVRLIADVMQPAIASKTGDIFYDGVSRVLSEPEFAEADAAMHARRVLEEQAFLKEFLAKVLSPNVGSVQVVIGGEGDWEELKDCSMVLARYGVTNVATGALGVLGPTRMSYGRAVSTVRYVAELMTDLMQETYGES
ncbi:MAG: heat-inducible transcription repressor HrcA [Chloroflexi bacterium]|nr:heat-inducible transcription repressor HrcA [Chloroflexota bacterium]